MAGPELRLSGSIGHRRCTAGSDRETSLEFFFFTLFVSEEESYCSCQWPFLYRSPIPLLIYLPYVHA
jgi:hypothetical protein